MALTSSTMLPLGTLAPEFILPDTLSHQTMSLTQLKSDVATVIMFICNHCPYVKHVANELVKLAHDYQTKKIAFIAISANDSVNHPDDAPEKMHETALKLSFTFPYLYDETQATAKAYHAACTPDFYVFDKDLRCIYRGQLDDSRPGNGTPVTGKDIRTTLDAVLANRPINPVQTPSVGCNIKWKN